MTSPRHRPHAPEAAGTEQELLLAVERSLRHNRRTRRDRIRWDRELWDAYIRSDGRERGSGRALRPDS